MHTFMILVLPLLLPIIFIVEKRDVIKYRFIFLIIGIMLCYGCSNFIAATLYGIIITIISAKTGDWGLMDRISNVGSESTALDYNIISYEVLYLSLLLAVCVIILSLLSKGFTKKTIEP